MEQAEERSNDSLAMRLQELEKENCPHIAHTHAKC